MPRYRYDRDLGTLYEVGPGSNYFEERVEAPSIIPDIEPYRAVAGDVAAGGKRPVIGGRRQHREFLRRNGLVEVGNDYDKRQVDQGQPRRETKAEHDAARARRIEDIKRAAYMVQNGMGYRPRPGDYE